MKLFYTLLLTIGLTSGLLASTKETLNSQLNVLKAAKSKIESTQGSLNKANSSVASQRTAIGKLKNDIQSERNEKNAIANRLQVAEEKYDKLKIKQLQTGRERDLFIVAFAVLATFSLYGLLKPFIGIIPPPYSYAAHIVSPIAIFIGVFFGIRLVVQLLVKFIF